MNEQTRILIALLLSSAILIGWQHFFGESVITVEQSAEQEQKALPDAEQHESILTREEAIEKGLSDGSRVGISNEYISASVNLRGAKIDDLSLRKYRKEIGGSERVVLLSPKASVAEYLAEFGWLNASSSDVQLPTAKTLWKLESSSERSMNLTWVNDHGLKFNILIAVDDRYMFDVTQSVENLSHSKVALHTYASIERAVVPYESNTIVHEGAIAVFNGKLLEVSYDDLQSEQLQQKKSKGWLGFSNKYWLVSAIPEADAVFNAKVAYHSSGDGFYKADLILNKVMLEPNHSYSEKIRLFAGAKNIEFLHDYQERYGIHLFDRAVDFGMLYFITKPIFLLLNYFYKLLNNFGYAILLLTVFIKLLLFPLAYKGFVSMNKLKMLHPKLAVLKEKYGDDAVAFQKAVMDFYKKEKANPMSGCLPLLLQMPVFFALYKVLSVTIEMRHAPFLGWIRDLSAPDPLNILNLFGLLPFTLPAFLTIGILPLCMAFTMYLQQSLNPAPTDPMQAKMMKYLPVVFLFLFTSFPSGLVLYWTWSNILSILQQTAIKKITG